MNARITHSQTFEDASGAPAVVVVDGFTFACDLLGRITINPVMARNGGGRIPAKARNGAEWLYKKWLATLPADYIARNAAFYA